VLERGRQLCILQITVGVLQIFKHIINVKYDSEPDWVIAQTMERHRRELEAEEVRYEERLATARRKEASMKRLAKARVTKKPVSPLRRFGSPATHLDICIETNP
jgi:hypothetical protein